MPLHKEEIRNIHFFIQAPVLLLAIYLSYQPIALKYFQTIGLVPVFILSLSVIYAIYISSPEELVYTQYYSAILLVISSMTVLRIRVKATVITILLLILIYAFVAIYFKGMLTTAIDTDYPVLFANSLVFFGVTAITVIMVNYIMESFSMHSFLASELLSEEKKQ